MSQHHLDRYRAALGRYMDRTGDGASRRTACQTRYAVRGGARTLFDDLPDVSGTMPSPTATSEAERKVVARARVGQAEGHQLSSQRRDDHNPAQMSASRRTR